MVEKFLLVFIKKCTFFTRAYPDLCLLFFRSALTLSCALTLNGAKPLPNPYPNSRLCPNPNLHLNPNPYPTQKLTHDAVTLII